MDNYTQAPGQLGKGVATVGQYSRRWLMASVAGVAVFATGCGADESDSIGSTEAAFTVHDCAMGPPNEAFVGKIDPALVSPRSYNSCYKGYIVDIENLHEDYSGSGGLSDSRISIAYADTPITDQATCEGTKLVAVFYEGWSGGVSAVSGGVTTGGFESGWDPITTESAFGSWFQGHCYMGVELSPLVAGKDYRVAATVRTPSNATRKLTMGTYKPQ